MKWYRINDYAITNGQEFSGPKNAYRHGTHIISKEVVLSELRYTLWDGERMVAIRGSAEELKRMAEKEVESV